MAPRFLSGRTMVMAGYFRRRFVVYPISKRHEDRGESLVNWVAEAATAESQPMPRQDWEYVARAEEVLKWFSSYTFDFLDMTNLVKGAAAIYQYPMVDRDPLPTWDFGRITLLGDAAHPMYPVGSNGASQAILDARVLARELALQGFGQRGRRGLRCARAVPQRPPWCMPIGRSALRSAWRLWKNGLLMGSPTFTMSSARTRWKRSPASTRRLLASIRNLSIAVPLFRSDLVTTFCSKIKPELCTTSGESTWIDGSFCSAPRFATSLLLAGPCAHLLKRPGLKPPAHCRDHKRQNPRLHARKGQRFPRHSLRRVHRR